MDNPLSKIFVTSPVVIDGGFGTTLEQWFQLDISNTPLWSTKAVVDHADLVIEAHLAFLRAGAELISTSTYQCSYPTFARAGYTTADARRIMSESVQLASKAREIFWDEQVRNGTPVRNVRIALSVGPFGASLEPAQEFDGFYPPPFGPKAYTHMDAENGNNFGDDEVAKNESIDALTQFHLERLLMLFENEAVWSIIDCIAFETVPLTREIRAIRRAMGLLHDRVGAGGVSIDKAKPWWISMVFPNGIYPETTEDGFSRIQVADIISAAIEHQSMNYPCPSGLGINCTQVEYLPKLISEFEGSLQNFQKTQTSSDWDSDILNNNIIKPWLVLYPNGGDIYDPVTQTWVEKNQANEEHWARTLTMSYTPSRIWAGVLLGGCCRTTPIHIQSLKQMVQSNINP
ncbi:MAG: Homocysteine S-methyltransferase [Lentinula lateritia]|nr:Homocysteine S-methyltransferase [Lentinula novae-zelandiae]KAJ3931152.1 MAG: Homocysteine S-methyltransferase [Lentinula lateritia]